MGFFPKETPLFVQRSGSTTPDSRRSGPHRGGVAARIREIAPGGGPDLALGGPSAIGICLVVGRAEHRTPPPGVGPPPGDSGRPEGEFGVWTGDQPLNHWAIAWTVTARPTAPIESVSGMCFGHTFTQF